MEKIMDINTSIYLLSALLIHLALVITFVTDNIKLIKLIIKLHNIPILLCLITAMTYLFNEKLNSLFCIDIPKYLMLITFIITAFGLANSWRNLFGFFDESSRSNRNK